MSKARRGESGEFPDLLGRRLRAGNEFGLAHTVKCMLISEFTRGFDGAHDGRKITIRTEIVALDYCGMLEVVAGQTDGARARWLHQSRCNRERVGWRCSKARGCFGRNRC